MYNARANVHDTKSCRVELIAWVLPASVADMLSYSKTAVPFYLPSGRNLGVPSESFHYIHINNVFLVQLLQGSILFKMKKVLYGQKRCSATVE